MKKIFIAALLNLIAFFTSAQNGLENIIVEKYYVSNAADQTGSIGDLPIGSVTYRIYADMLPGYKFQAAYGVPGHTLLFTTSTAFFNNEDRGATTPTYTKTQARANTVMLDSWLSVGAACTGNFGILKSEDNVASGGATVINSTVPPILQNNDPAAGIALTIQDGIYAGTPEAVTFVGLSVSDLDVFDAVSNVNDTFITANASWASLNGSTGPIPATNKVLIAQITTDGTFHYELNIQIGTPTGGTQNYVAMNPVGSEISLPSLMGTLGGSNINPTVGITSPSNGASFLTGSTVAITANAGDADGTVSSVEFFVDAVSIGIDNTAPYSINYTAVSGTHTLTAKATDNSNGQTTSAGIPITVNSNPPPSVNITSPANGATFLAGTLIPINANASDNGSITNVEFFVDGISIGIDNTSPYSINYTITNGSHTLTAVATDNQSAQTTSAVINISAGSNIPPTVNITAPLNGDLFTHPTIINILVDAIDPDGTISLVEFYINGVLVGSDATSPYSFNWTSVIGVANITARARDNNNAQTTSAGVLISVADPNIPYKIVTSKDICVPSNFCIPITAIDTVENVIGYDIVMNYNTNKVQPTGIITVNNTLVNPAYVDILDTIDNVNGILKIFLFFNSSAPANTFFSGLGDLICVEFAKTTNFGSIDSATFSISSLKESYFTGVSLKNVDPGKYITYRDTAFSGTLKFWINNNPLGYNSANPAQLRITNIFGNNTSCTSISAGAVQPDINGQFNYSTTNGTNIAINRDIQSNTSVQPVVNGFDALLTRKLLIQDPSFIPTVYQIIAADVNIDGVISAGDISQINQRAVLMIPEFLQAWNYNPQGGSNGQLSKDWLFIDTVTVATNPSYQISATFPADNGVGFSSTRVPIVPFCLAVPGTNFSSCPVITSMTYKGILIGDINGNFSTVGSGGSFKLNNPGKVSIDFSKSIISEGYLDMPLQISSINTINSLDFSLLFDESLMKFESIKGLSVNMQARSNYNETDHTLRFTSYSLENLETETTILYIRFKFEGNSLSGNEISSFNAYLNGDESEVELKKSIPNSHLDNSWINVFPNPASTNLNIEISESANIQIFDLQGRVICEKNVNANEIMELSIDGLKNGIYILKAINNRFTIVKSVVVSK